MKKRRRYQIFIVLNFDNLIYDAVLDFVYDVGRAYDISRDELCLNWWIQLQYSIQPARNM